MKARFAMYAFAALLLVLGVSSRAMAQIDCTDCIFDADGDGFNDASDDLLGCFGASPPGWSATCEAWDLDNDGLVGAFDAITWVNDCGTSPIVCGSSSQLTVGGGSGLRLGNGTLALGCGDIAVAGTLNGDHGMLEVQDVAISPGGTVNELAGTFEITGNWHNAGTYNSGTGSVDFIDGCGVSVAAITGATRFSWLSMITALGKTYEFDSTTTQTVTDNWVLAGAPASLLRIRSTAAGRGTVDLQGMRSANLVDIDDNDVLTTPVFLWRDSIIGPNTSGWSFLNTLPTLSPVAFGLLTLSLAWGAAYWLRLRQRPRMH